MWWHADAPNRAYNWLLQGHAVSDKVEGPYTYVDAYLPLGNWSQDFGLFTDYKTKTTYALYSNGDRREGRDVYLTSYNKNITGLDKVIHRWDKYDLESPSIVQTDVGYFAIMSHKTGYRPNSKFALNTTAQICVAIITTNLKQMWLLSVPISWRDLGLSHGSSTH